MTGLGPRLTATAILALSVSCAPHTPGPFFVGGWIVVSTYTAWDQRGLAVLSPGDGTTVGYWPGQDRVESLTTDEQGRLSVYGRSGRFVYAIE